MRPYEEYSKSRMPVTVTPHPNLMVLRGRVIYFVLQMERIFRLT